MEFFKNKKCPRVCFASVFCSNVISSRSQQILEDSVACKLWLVGKASLTNYITLFSFSFFSSLIKEDKILGKIKGVNVHRVLRTVQGTVSSVTLTLLSLLSSLIIPTSTTTATITESNSNYLV